MRTVPEQYQDFVRFRPTLDQSETTIAGEIVSVTVRQAIPGGAVMKLASKTETFGPFRLTPVVVSELVMMLSRTNPQHSR